MFKRAFTAAGLLVALGVAPLATAAPASATTSQCTGILNSYGYRVGAKATEACGWHHKTGFGGIVLANPNCLTGLVALGVKYSHAETACEWA
jgi:hypothetical protein